MKVLLIAPYYFTNADDRSDSIDKREDFLPSSALMFLGAVLREHNHEPILLDLNSSYVHKKVDKKQYCLNVILSEIEKQTIQLVGFNCLFSGIFPSILEYAGKIKEKFPNVKIAIGGLHPTTYSKKILESCKEIDYVVLGEGEIQIVRIADSIEQNDFIHIDKISSFAYRNEDNEVNINNDRSFIDFNELPMPAWDLINFKDYEIDLSHYYNPKQHARSHLENIVPIFSSRGCPFNCSFCDMFHVMGKEHRRRDAVKVVDQIEFIHKEYGMNYFQFLDDNLTLNRGHILGICKEINNRKLDIQFDTSNGLNINSLNEEVIAAMASAGLVDACIAIEHGSDYIRNEVIGKKLKRETIYEVAELLRKYKVQTGGLFIAGFPEETNETLADSYKMMTELKLDRMATGWAIPFPGTALFDQVRKDDLFTISIDFDQLWKQPISFVQKKPIIKPYNMSVEELLEWKSKFECIRYKYFGRYQ